MPMMSKKFFEYIGYLQEAFLSVSFLTLVSLPIVEAYFPDALPQDFITFLYEVSLTAAFLVLSIRPLADLFPKVPELRALVILRKGVGAFSASIIVSFMLAKFLVNGFGYFAAFFSAAHWSPDRYAILSPLGDLSAFILLITSNKFAKRSLGMNWRRIQKLAYVYFYAGALYEYLVLGQSFAFWFALTVFGLSAGAFIKKRVQPLALAV